MILSAFSSRRQMDTSMSFMICRQLEEWKMPLWSQEKYLSQPLDCWKKVGKIALILYPTTHTFMKFHQNKPLVYPTKFVHLKVFRGHRCKHLVLTDLLSEHDSQKFPALNYQINAHASVIKQKKLYSILCFDTKEVDVKSLCNERIYYTSAATFQCTCCTFSYNEKCACLLLACELFDVILTRDVPTLWQEDMSMQLNVNTEANHSKT